MCCKLNVKKILLFLVLSAVAALVGQYLALEDSKKRFVRHLAAQLPYLPGRYFA